MVVFHQKKATKMEKSKSRRSWSEDETVSKRLKREATIKQETAAERSDLQAHK